MGEDMSLMETFPVEFEGDALDDLSEEDIDILEAFEARINGVNATGFELEGEATFDSTLQGKGKKKSKPSYVTNKGYSHDSVQQYSGERWMSKLDDSTKVSQLSIVGTHDTLSFYGGDIVQCQSMSFMNQLKSGVRFLDIRVRHYYNKWKIYHGFVYQRKDFSYVVSELEKFLTANPREIVLMKVQGNEQPAKGATRTMFQTFEAYMSKKTSNGQTFGERFACRQSNPRLGDCRGKVIIYRIYWGSGRSKYSAAHMSDVFVDGSKWQLTTNWDLHNFWTEHLARMKRAINGNQNQLYFSSASGAGGSFPYFVASGKSSPGTSAPRLLTGRVVYKTNKHTYPWFPRVGCWWKWCSIAFEGLNQLTQNVLASGQVKGRIGVIQMDFPGGGVIKEIIKQNDVHKGDNDW